MVSRRFRFSKNQRDEIVQAILTEDSQTLERIGFTSGTIKQYIAFAKMAKKDSAKALRAYPRLSKTITYNITNLISQPDIIQSYKNTIQVNLENLGIDEIFDILDTTKNLIITLGLERAQKGESRCLNS